MDYKFDNKLDETNSLPTSSSDFPDELCDHVQRRFGMLYSYYKPECYWWEILGMVRKFVVVGLLSLLDPGSYFQTVISIFIAVVFFGTSGRLKKHVH